MTNDQIDAIPVAILRLLGLELSAPMIRDNARKIIVRALAAADPDEYTLIAYQVGFAAGRNLRGTAPAPEARDAARLRVLVAEFIKAHDAAQPYVDAIFAMQQNRTGPYTGPQYGKELDALRAAMSATPPQEPAAPGAKP